MSIYYLNSPLKNEDIENINIGDSVYISGPVFTCRSRLHKYIFDEGNKLPFSTKNRNSLIHVGPIVIKENGKWKLVSFMPTSSIRFEKWGEKSVKEWNLKLIVGKTTMGKKTADAMKKFKCIHVSPQSVSPNLWIDTITIEDVYLFNELGTIEAAWQMKLDKLGPFVVDIDSKGNNLFDALDKKIEENKIEAYKKMGIPQDFEYTKLY
jgi:tartrate/fumarate subfamily iron-sulfur-dependent hydro-lyase beta chain